MTINLSVWQYFCATYCHIVAHTFVSLRWRHNGRISVSNHQPHDCLINRLFRRRSKKTSKLRVTGLCVGNSPGTGEFPAQMASNAENVSIWWRHHMHQWTGSSLVQVMACHLLVCGTKPSPEPMVTNHQQNLKNKTVKFKKRYNNFHSRKWI